MEIHNLKITNWKEWFQEQKKKQIPSHIYPSDYNISTVTTNCRIFYQRHDEPDKKYPIFINYLRFFNICELEKTQVEYKKYRFRDKKWDWEEMRENLKPQQKSRGNTRKNSKMKGVFYNQVTLEVYSECSNKQITTFLYDNGSLNNTGNKKVEDTYIISSKIIDVLKKCNQHMRILYHYKNVNLSNWDETRLDELDVHLSENLEVLDMDNGTLVMDNLNISTMNAKYFAGIKINRDSLFKLIKRMNETNKDSDIYLALLETSNYAGLNIKVRWKKNCNEDVHVKCKSKWKCKCTDITILAFQSGEIMISGSKSIEQLDYVKELFDKLIRDNIEEVIDIDLNSIITIPNQKRVKRVHKYFNTSYIEDKTFIVVSNEGTNS